MLTTLLPFIPYLLSELPSQFFGFNLTGYAWIIMLLVTTYNLFLTTKISFPVLFWLPWVLYLIGYLVIDYSFIGFQLTLQYILPVMIGIVASGFNYSVVELQWLFKWFMRLCASVFAMSVFGYLFRGGYTPATAATPMLLSISLSLICALYFTIGKTRYLIFAGLLFMAPVINVTRMGIAAMAAVFILHFANRNLRGKLMYGLIGLVALLFVFNSKSFQEKTFFSGHGKLSDLAFNYFENQDINNNDRHTWKDALQPGLETAPAWGNGPRADLAVLLVVSKESNREAHNDYLAVRYNYGYIGLGLLLAGFIFTFFSIFRISHRFIEDDFLWLLSTSTLTLFFSFFMFMYSDNILKYTVYFPNYFFAMIGIIYSLKQDEDNGYYPIIQY